jgi:hypothetical protein
MAEIRERRDAVRNLRLAGLLFILLAVVGGLSGNARASAPVTCWKYCGNIFYSGQCWASLAQCCQFNHRCPFPYTFVAGDCTDGTNYCP